MLSYAKALDMVSAAKEHNPDLRDAWHVIARTDLLGFPHIEAYFEGDAPAEKPEIALAAGLLKMDYFDHVPKPRLLCGVAGGDRARAEFAPAFGTAGWNIQLDSRKMCLSNAHVFGDKDGRVQFELPSGNVMGTVRESKAAKSNGATN